MCAERLSYKELKQIAFKIFDAGEIFYFILNRNVSILKLIKVSKVEMAFILDIQYSIFLLNSEEEYLLNKVIKANDSILSLTSIKDIKTKNKLILWEDLSENLKKTIIGNR